ncbi:hypothetical protein D6745_03450 [Candidatus Woesearchaeota archaeon]|nr:MAG: hypothetical protein D6745_03450 [Candidatus Woesearchaeota archaeon]
MYKEIYPLAARTLKLIEELKEKQQQKNDFLSGLERIDNEYSQGRLTFKDYQKKISEFLNGRTKEQVLAQFKREILLMLRKIEMLNSQLYATILTEKTHIDISLLKEEEELFKKTDEEFEKTLKEIEKPFQPVFGREIAEPQEEAFAKGEMSAQQIAEKAQKIAAEHRKELQSVVKEQLEDLDKPTEKHEPLFKKDKLKDILPKGAASKDEGLLTETQLIKKHDDKEVHSGFKAETIEVGKEKKKTPLPEEFKRDLIGPTRRKQVKVFAQESKALASIYKPSFFGSLANILMRPISNYLERKLPQFYNYMRVQIGMANMKVLTTTYVNEMILTSALVFIISMMLSFGIFAIFGGSITGVFLKSFFTSLFLSGATFASFVYYPQTIIGSRRKSIVANLPFALNHMSAISTAGVPPLRMFQLIANSKDYGEVSNEIEKISLYTNIFGYDMITAIQVVLEKTPSPQLKTIFAGFVSTIETGGDLNKFLKQKAEEAALAYRLERQKYLDTISTYSDIYTGVLIAGPLFFIIALSLINVIGGKVGGITIDMLMGIGTYFLIPILNIFFILFLNFTQPEL